jgi:hypothetical protein
MKPLDDDDLNGAEQLLAEVGAGIDTSDHDPLVRLLQAARGPATQDELVDTTHFAERVAAGALLGASPAAEPLRPRDRVPTGRTRTVAVKTAVVAAIGVLGLAGAAAASGIVVNDPPASTTSAPPASAPTTMSVPATTAEFPLVPVPVPGAASPEVPVGPRADDDGADRVSPPTPGSDATTAGAATPPVVPGSNGAVNGSSPQAGGNPTPGSNGADHGNSPNAGGNPTPGSNGAENGNSPNAGGNPTPGGNGAVNGNSPNAGGNPTPGSNGADHGNSPQAGGNPVHPTLGDPGAVNATGADRSGVPVETVS